MAKEKAKIFRTPLGRISFPALHTPYANPKIPTAAKKYGCQILVPLAEFQKSEDAKLLLAEINRVGQEAFGPNWTLKTAKNKPVQKTDDMENVSDERTLGHVAFKASGNEKSPPLVTGPDAKELSLEAIQKIKGGDYGRMFVTVYSYDNVSKGVSLGLRAVQFQKPGEAFGQGNKAVLELMDEIEVPVTDGDMDGMLGETGAMLV